ncbi:MAG: 4-alpha-glucanotransferase [Acidimicrobiia bacterium]|nr:4-alpha-glucanotransferase [Acidimicrobiia bacterium]
MLHERSSGVLLHPTSFAGPHGIGDLGPAAYRWVDTLVAMGCRYWQVLPLGPTGYGDSPYQCFSSFAGNPLLISPDLLISTGLLTAPLDTPEFPAASVDYGPTIEWKTGLLTKAFEAFADNPHPELEAEFEYFLSAESFWLDNFSMFMVIKAEQGGGSFTDWAEPLRDRHPAALAKVRQSSAADLRQVAFWQFLFFKQWAELRSYATGRGIRIIGDLPIFVSPDSADVWANRDLFELDEIGKATLITGVPPDYFSATGQLWGNPQYRWGAHHDQNFSWWIQRLAATLRFVELVRIDHFRAFADYWEIPAGSPTAETGRWVDGPGETFFNTVAEHFPEMPIIAEDLGEISQAVFDLRDRFQLPGMKILQFAFDGDLDNPFLPHYFPENCVVYTGTHDNDTTVGWWMASDEETRHQARLYLSIDGSDIAWDLIRAGWHSRAALAIAPLQDLLRLDSTARMNVPGEPAGNWSWRMADDQIPESVVESMRDLNVQTRR